MYNYTYSYNPYMYSSQGNANNQQQKNQQQQMAQQGPIPEHDMSNPYGDPAYQPMYMKYAGNYQNEPVYDNPYNFGYSAYQNAQYEAPNEEESGIVEQFPQNMANRSMPPTPSPNSKPEMVQKPVPQQTSMPIQEITIPITQVTDPIPKTNENPNNANQNLNNSQPNLTDSNTSTPEIQQPIPTQPQVSENIENHIPEGNSPRTEEIPAPMPENPAGESSNQQTNESIPPKSETAQIQETPVAIEPPVVETPPVVNQAQNNLPSTPIPEAKPQISVPSQDIPPMHMVQESKPLEVPKPVEKTRVAYLEIETQEDSLKNEIIAIAKESASRIRNLQEKTYSLQNEIKTMKSNFEEQEQTYKSQIDSINQTSQATIQDLQKQIAENNEKFEAEKKDLQAQIASNNEKFEAEKQELQKQIAENNEKFEKEKKDRLAEIEELEFRINKLTAQIDSFEAEAKKKEMIMNQQNNQVKRLNENLNESMKREADLQYILDEKTKKLQAAEESAAKFEKCTVKGRAGGLQLTLGAMIQDKRLALNTKFQTRFSLNHELGVIFFQGVDATVETDKETYIVKIKECEGTIQNAKTMEIPGNPFTAQATNQQPPKQQQQPPAQPPKQQAQPPNPQFAQQIPQQPGQYSPPQNPQQPGQFMPPQKPQQMNQQNYPQQQMNQPPQGYPQQNYQKPPPQPQQNYPQQQYPNQNYPPQPQNYPQKPQNVPPQAQNTPPQQNIPQQYQNYQIRSQNPMPVLQPNPQYQPGYATQNSQYQPKTAPQQPQRGSNPGVPQLVIQQQPGNQGYQPQPGVNSNPGYPQAPNQRKPQQYAYQQPPAPQQGQGQQWGPY